MIAKIKSLYFRVRREVRFVWGRQWKLRSLFVPHGLRCTAEAYLHEHADKMFFVFGTGRSGMQPLSDLLHRAVNVSVLHETNFDKSNAHKLLITVEAGGYLEGIL